MDYRWNYSSTHKAEKIEKREEGDGLNVRERRTFSFFAKVHYNDYFLGQGDYFDDQNDIWASNSIVEIWEEN